MKYLVFSYSPYGNGGIPVIHDALSDALIDADKSARAFATDLNEYPTLRVDKYGTDIHDAQRRTRPKISPQTECFSMTGGAVNGKL